MGIKDYIVNMLTKKMLNGGISVSMELPTFYWEKQNDTKK